MSTPPHPKVGHEILDREIDRCRKQINDLCGLVPEMRFYHVGMARGVGYGLRMVDHITIEQNDVYQAIIDTML